MSPSEHAELPALSLNDFPAYFSALWSSAGSAAVEPFPWQVELLQAASEQRRWPDVIDLPTGSGKTSLIDLAVFMLALGAGEPPSEQWHPRRIALVVDRRVIVDQAAERAGEIAEQLVKAGGGVLKDVADRLRSLALAPDGSAPDPPLCSAVLRGGIVRDESWAYRPDVPAVLASTVDQVGSRLLMRGYGVSRGMRPIHAGLLGEDVLYLLDEVHLARPYAETLDAVRRYRRLGRRSDELPDRWQVTQLSATVESSAGWTFPGRPLHSGSHPVIDRRITAPKPAVLAEVAVTADVSRARQKIAEACAQRAGALLSTGARTIAVIVNRVDTARRAYESLASLAKKADVRLITGRMRPIDRERVLADIGPRVANGRVRSDGDQPLVLVATQSIEAGADFDLDAIVTECASLDALRQRFGRVDRDGMLGVSGTTYQSTILAGSRDITPGSVDPVYGEALRNTWQWLSGFPELDFGIQRFRPPASAEDLKALLPPQRHAPLLLPSHLDRWVRTSQYDVAADPEVAQWLHGIDASNDATDVFVVWREDLDEDLLIAAKPPKGGQPATEAQERTAARLRVGVEARLDACPPRPEEMLTVPLNGVRAWLAEDPDQPTLADAWINAPDDMSRRRRTKNVVCWRDDCAQVISGQDIVPGDTIIVPATRGGITGGTWNPTSTMTVVDVADAAYANRRTLVLRLSSPLNDRLQVTRRATQAVEAGLELSDQSEDVQLDEAAEYPDPERLRELPLDERVSAVRGYVTAMADDADGSTQQLMTALIDSSKWRLQSCLERVVDGHEVQSYVIEASRQRGSLIGVSPYSGLAEDDGRDGPSFSDAGATSLITLDQHLDGVRRWAECLATNLGLNPGLAAGLGLAGQLHDLGKLDGRFQLWLHGGDELSWTSIPAPLAKSVTVSDPATRAATRRLSGYPAGQRHELLSLSLASGAVSGPHADLVRHLVATHHGNGRYRFDAQSDLAPLEVRFCAGDEVIRGTTAHTLDELGSGTGERFWRLVRDWGWYGLAWLEAVLRLADHQDSRSPQVAAMVRSQDE